MSSALCVKVLIQFAHFGRGACSTGNETVAHLPAGQFSSQRPATRAVGTIARSTAMVGLAASQLL